MGPKHASSPVLNAVCCGWLCLVLLGTAGLWKYKQTPGGDSMAPASWPAESKLRRATDRPTLLLFVHPHCACSQASIGELGRLVARSQGLALIQVLFFRPGHAAAGWARGSLWEAAAAIPGVSLREDADGVEARRFAAETSGHAVLYDVQGKRVFDGGITASRGHAGDNAGLDALLGLLHQEAKVERHTHVFGCRIQDRNKTKTTACEGTPCAK